MYLRRFTRSSIAKLAIPLATTLIALVVIGCRSAPPPLIEPRPTYDHYTAHVRIDDAVIERGDPYDVIDPVLWMGDAYAGEVAYEESMAPFTREQRYVFAVIVYQGEVDNGGHDQFYYNSSGTVWRDALAGLRDMGADENAAILEESARRLGGNPSLDRETRWGQMDQYRADFGDLDDRFYAIDLEAIMREYIRANRAAFYWEGDVEKVKAPWLPTETPTRAPD